MTNCIIIYFNLLQFIRQLFIQFLLHRLQKFNLPKFDFPISYFRHFQINYLNILNIFPFINLLFIFYPNLTLMTIDLTLITLFFIILNFINPITIFLLNLSFIFLSLIILFFQMLYFPFLIFERYLNFNIIFLINLIIFYFELKEIYKKKEKETF